MCDFSEGCDSDDDNNSDTWALGDKCLVRWSEDQEWYSAEIKKFRKTSLHTLALVSFSGYDSDDDEWISISKLKRRCNKKVHSDPDITVIDDPVESTSRHNTTLFQPLTGEEKQQMLVEKYKDVDDAVSPVVLFPDLASPKWPTTSKKLVSLKNTSQKSSRSPARPELHITGGNAKSTKSPWSQARNKLDCKSADRTLEITSYHSDSDEETSTSELAGFTEEDLERPFFPKVVTSCQEPLVLSEPSVNPAIQVPVTINRYLRDYQREGVHFLYKHYVENHGGLLADDMGLGKTVQVIAFIAAILGRTGTKSDILAQKPSFIRKLSDHAADYKDFPKRSPFLIIGPASVLYNWIDEFNTWGYFNVGKYHKNYKAQTLADLRRSRLDVVVTTYETCRDHVEELNDFVWEAVFADEAHKIKGLKTEVTKALRELNCPRRFGLTGTPLQNNVKEMWSLFDWCNPGCLGELKSFMAKIGGRIEKGQNHNATKRELAEARKAKEKLAEYRERWMLRRMKTIIKDQLPEKSELVVYCRPTRLQQSVYKAIFNLEWMDAVLKQRDPCPCDSGSIRRSCCFKKLGNGKSIWAQTMSYMHLLLKASNHIALLLPQHTTNENQRKEAEKICETVFSEHPQFIEQSKQAAFKTLSDPKFCGKMKILQGLLSVFKKQKSKVLVFSYSTKLLDILETYVMSMGFEYFRLDGQTKEVNRVHLVRQFNNDPNIFLFLVSTKAGGVGLNLTGANVVVIFDPNWNPTWDLQAQDRAYRIGQRRDVRIYRLITSGTIEENIYLRQIHKQQLGDVAVSTKNAKRLFYTNELFGIESTFHFRTGDRCLTEDILKRHSKVEEGLIRPKKLKEDGEMGDFDIEEYVPPPKEQDEDAENDSVCDQGTSNAVGTEKSNLVEDDSEGSNFGLGYVCTQLMDLGQEQKPETSKCSPNKTLKSPPKGKRHTSGHSLTVDIQASPTKHTQQFISHDDDDESLDDLLGDLVDIGAPMVSPKSTKTSNQTDTSKQKTWNSRSEKKYDDIWEDSDLAASDNECDNIKPESVNHTVPAEKHNHNSVDDLWEEMESMRTEKEPGVEMKNIGNKVKNSKNGEQKCKGGPYKSTKMTPVIKSTVRHEPASESEDENKELLTSFLTAGNTMENDMIESDSDGVIPNKRSTKHRKKSSSRTAKSSRSTELKRKSGGRKAVKICESRNIFHEGVESSEELFQGKRSRSSAVGTSLESGDFDATFASVTDVFAQCGVVHTHQNRKVTGSSRAEDHMSRCAIQDVYERHCNTQAPAMQCQPREEETYDSLEEESFQLPSSSKKPPRGSRKQSTKVSKNSRDRKPPKNKSKVQIAQSSGFFQGPRSVVVGGKKVLIGQTPKAVCRQQFKAISQHIHRASKLSKSDDPVAVAQLILKSSGEQHRDWLKTFYSEQDAVLADAIRTEEGENT